MNWSTLIVIGVAIVLGLLLLGGGGREIPMSEPAEPLTSTARPEFGETGSTLRVDVGGDMIVGEREAVQLAGTVTGAAAGAVSYRWTGEGRPGFFSSPNLRDPIYTSPSACDCEERVVLTLTATDSRGALARDSLVLTVRDPSACPPDPCIPKPISAPVDLCAVHVRVPCLSQADAPCERPCTSDAPSADPCGQVVIPCPCTAGGCASAWSSSWPAAPSPGVPGDRSKPRIVRQYPAHISEGSAFELTGTIGNPACVSGCFVWVANKGSLEGVDTLSPTYRAPQVDRSGGERVTISLILYDGFGGRSYDQIRVTIDNLDYVGPPVP